MVSMLVPHHRKGTVMCKVQHEKTTIRACMVGRGDGRESCSRVRAPPKRFCNRLRIWVLSSRWLRPLEQGSGLRAWWEKALGQ